ncbi:hypothetical protein LZD49_17520 [Dyadobacter sp. CY261]|uniref:hypothetical protein n=1 Tax=Dyadobacter sp. CY261 TaxID=2907203 RepID=UPI001F2DCE41|nr:hypothetical protein [Dyadobacter sp. CY261]MCF0072284.1 hypothetical protein [Dyadobacter sp. CY261]
MSKDKIEKESVKPDRNLPDSLYGSINQTQYWVTGTFVVQPAGWLNTATQLISIGTASIRGVFRVKPVGQL